MITTRFGSEIEPIERHPNGRYTVRRISDGSLHLWHISDFKYDVSGLVRLTSMKEVITI